MDLLPAAALLILAKSENSKYLEISNVHASLLVQ